MTKILVTGANGQLGQSIKKISARFSDFELIYADREMLDITDNEKVQAYIPAISPDIIIHAAAYTAVDMAETESEKCYAINQQGSEYIATAAERINATVIYISSDYVYHNTYTRPLETSDPTTPQGIYARSKLYGEWATLSACSRVIVVRTAWVYSEFKSNFVKTMARLMQAGKDLRVVADQIGTPTYAPHLAEVLLMLINTLDLKNDFFHHIYNYADSEAITWYAFAEDIQKAIGTSVDISPTTTAIYNAPAPRPSYSVLNSDRLRSIINYGDRPLHIGLETTLRAVGVFSEK